jgi:Transposase IS116/IS110/IS902 family
MEATGCSRWCERLKAELEALKRAEVRRLMTHSCVGPITALAFVLIIGTPEHFRCGKQVGSYLGLIPCEDSFGGRQRWGTSVSKAIRCCVSYWWKQLTLPHVPTPIGNDDTYIWPCVGSPQANPEPGGPSLLCQCFHREACAAEGEAGEARTQTAHRGRARAPPRANRTAKLAG